MWTKKKKIKGGHDEQAFRDFVAQDGQWEITKATPHPDHPDITLLEYRPLKKNKDGSFVEPKEYKGGEIYQKTVIKGLANDEAKWFAAMSTAFDEAIERCAIQMPTDGKVEIMLTVDGLEMFGYLQDGVVTTLWPAFVE